ncbi:hypothetical protein [Paenibacillus chibensis]|uniref:hypothetical protein n=1 Tax=Paenibacillus chibensis TaxID=59846 RepID=UPI000FDAE8A7|nr:hypothetical protein [Paenibacillus chibensis]MEC0373333.1 hypothetical protein [Paenibacillus chibensis]
MSRRTEEQRLAELDQRMEQLKAKKQQLQAQISQKERKARTRRLIQIGAIFEQYFGVQVNEQVAADVIKNLHDLAGREERGEIRKID